MAVGQKDLGVGRKIFFVLMLAVVAGFLWAMVEKRKSFGDLMKVFSGPEEKSNPGPVAEKEEKKAPVVKEEKKEEKKKEEKKEEKKNTPVTHPDYTDREMGLLFEAVDLLLRDAKYLEARDKLASVNKMRVPNPTIQKFEGLRERVNTYYRLILETTRGGTVDIPPLSRLKLRIGNSRGLVVRSLTSDSSKYYFEDIRGIRSNLPKEQVQSVESLDAIKGGAAIWAEVTDSQAEFRGIKAERKSVEDVGLVYAFSDKTNRTPTGLQFFELADFCAKNGLNGPLTPIFDEALKRDPDLIKTVHESKGERMVDVFIYFLSVNSKSDAEFTLKQILVPRYSDTRAYREKVLQDKETKDAIAIVTKRKVDEAELEKKPVAGGNDTNGTNTSSNPPPVEKPVEPPDTSPSDPGDASKPTPLPPDAPAKARELVAKGDKLFGEGHQHLMKSTPTANPTGWADENHKALLCFAEAFDKCYYPAQEEFEKAGMKSPTSLNERANETQMRRSMCRKRSVSNK